MASRPAIEIARFEVPNWHLKQQAAEESATFLTKSLDITNCDILFI